MKTSPLRFFFLTVLSLTLLFCFVSCTGSDEPDAGENPEPDDASVEVIPPDDPGDPVGIVLASDGAPLYTVVRSEDANDMEVNAAIEFRKRLMDETGVTFEFGTDWVKKGQEPDMSTPEILVGITNRTSQETLDSLGMIDYAIQQNGSKIEILAKSERGMEQAIEAFFSDEVFSPDGSYVVLNALPVRGTVKFPTDEVPDFPFGKIEAIYESSDTTTVVKASGTTAEDYAAYLDLLHQVGFTDYATNEIAGNLFTTLTNDTTTVNTYYIASTGVTRVISEDKGPLYPLTDEYEDLGLDCLLTGMKGETSVASEGMGFIIRLKDGSFVIIDGGMGDPDSVDSDKLMNILREQAPEGVEKPVIAAWLFTHLHGDHIGVFNCFSIDHHDDVVIERIYCNFPKDEETAASDSPYMLDDTIYRYTQFRKCMKEYYADVPLVKLHTGNTFMVRNAKFEVLETLEDIVPKTILDGGMNECSILYKMTLEGQTTLWTGDIAFIATDVALQQFGDYLQCDMLQMAHHGLNGTVKFYSTVDPTYTFLPVWAGGFQQMEDYAQNQWLIDSPKMKHMIVTGCGTWTIKLPYDPVDGTFDRTPTWRTKHPVYPELLGNPEPAPEEANADMNGGASEPSSYAFEAQYIRTDGYHDEVSYPVVTLIESKEELDAYYEANKDRYDLERHEAVYSDQTIGFLDACDRYDQAYFDGERNLILILLEEPSGSIRHEITDVCRNDSGEWVVTVDRFSSGAVTDDMAEWHLFLEIQMGNVITREDTVVVNLR